MWYKEKFFKYSVAIIFVLLIIILAGQLGFIIYPVLALISVLFFPLLIAGFLYYLLRPLVGLVEKLKINRAFSILIVFILVIGVFVLLGMYAGSLISKQFTQLFRDLPGMIDSGKDTINDLLDKNNFGSDLTKKIQDQVANTLQNIFPKIYSSIVGALSTVTGIVTILIMVPFIVFYLLKDGHIFYKLFLNIFPQKYRNEVISILDETDKTLSVYIIGQAIIAIILGTLMYIGYMIIGMKYALILAIFALLTSFIPMFGTIIGVIPAMIVGLAIEPFMVLKILIVVIIVNQLEGNLISPFVVGKRLEIHPLTLILLFLAAASFFGFVGMLIAVPLYAVIKIQVKNLLRLYKLWKNKVSNS